MNILVIGSEGTIGTQLVKKLKEQHGNRIFCCDRVRKRDTDYTMADIGRYETLEPVFNVKPNVVFHLAGEVSRETAEHWPTIAVENNVLGTLNVLQLCARSGAKIVFAGTSEEYGELFFSGAAVTEDMRPTRQQGVYGLTKWLAEEFIEYFHRRYKVPAIIVRIFMCYGPGEYPSPYRSAVTRFIDWARRGEPLHVHRGGQRSWCYIDDTVAGISAAAGYDKEPFAIFNVGNEEVVSMEAVAREIVRLTNSKSEIILEDAPLGVTLVKRASFKKAADVLGWKAHVSFKEGLERTVAWHMDNVPLLK